MKFGFCAKHRGTWPVALMCEALDVSRSGFYAWLTRPRSLRSIVDEVLGIQVRQSFVGSDRTYGARRVWHDVLAGIAVMSLGIYGLSVGQEVSHLVSLGMPSMVLIVGLAVMLISALGLYAAVTESSNLLRFVHGDWP